MSSLPLPHDGFMPRDSFETTQWSIVLAAGGATEDAAATAALEELCRRYWWPLFAYVRREGRTTADAQDLVQGFFARILERRDLAAVRRERGRFRSYLLTAFQHYLINEAEHASAAKRGGGRTPISLDALMQRRGLAQAAADELRPDRLFDREWARALLERVLEQVRAALAAEGNEHHFEHLKGYLTAEPDLPSQAEIARALGLSEGAIKQAVFRLRRRYRQLLHDEVAETVATQADVEGELRHLIASLRD